MVELVGEAAVIVALDATPNKFIHFREKMEHVTLQFGNVGMDPRLRGGDIERNFFLRGETIQRAQQKSKRIPDTAVKIADVFEAVLTDADVFGVIRRHHPQAQIVRAISLHDLQRIR